MPPNSGGDGPSRTKQKEPDYEDNPVATDRHAADLAAVRSSLMNTLVFSLMCGRSETEARTMVESAIADALAAG